MQEQYPLDLAEEVVAVVPQPAVGAEPDRDARGEVIGDRRDPVSDLHLAERGVDDAEIGPAEHPNLLPVHLHRMGADDGGDIEKPALLEVAHGGCAEMLGDVAGSPVGLGEMLGNEHPAVAREFLDQAQLLLVEKFLRKAADDGRMPCSRHSEKNAA